MLDFDNEEVKSDVEVEKTEEVAAVTDEVEESVEAEIEETAESNVVEDNVENEVTNAEPEISEPIKVEEPKKYDEYDYDAKYQKTYAKYNFGAHRENDKTGEYHTDKSYANNSQNVEEKWEGGTRSGGWVSFFRSFPFPMICLVIYLIIGFVCKAWHPGWIIFLAIPAYHSVVEIYATQGKVRVPLFSIVLIAYLLMGFLGNLWHPGWLIFFAWPLYFVFFNLMKIENTHIIIFTLLCIGIYVIIGVVLHIWHPTWIIFLSIPIFESLYISATKLVKEKKEGKVDNNESK